MMFMVRIYGTSIALGGTYFMYDPSPYLHFNFCYIGTLYSPTDGTIDPNGICTATTRSAKKAGAKVIRCFGEKNLYRILLILLNQIYHRHRAYGCFYISGNRGLYGY